MYRVVWRKEKVNTVFFDGRRWEALPPSQKYAKRKLMQSPLLLLQHSLPFLLILLQSKCWNPLSTSIKYPSLTSFCGHVFWGSTCDPYIFLNCRCMSRFTSSGCPCSYGKLTTTHCYGSRKPAGGADASAEVRSHPERVIYNVISKEGLFIILQGRGIRLEPRFDGLLWVQLVTPASLKL